MVSRHLGQTDWVAEKKAPERSTLSLKVELQHGEVIVSVWMASSWIFHETTNFPPNRQVQCPVTLEVKRPSHF